MSKKQPFWEPMKAEKMKYAIIAFWLSAAFAILPRYLGEYLELGRPCALCITQNMMYTILMALCFFAKWSPTMRNIAEKLTYIIALVAIYHALIVFNLIPGPKICMLNATLFDKLLAACNQSKPWMVGASFSLALLVNWLLKKAK